MEVTGCVFSRFLGDSVAIIMKGITRFSRVIVRLCNQVCASFYEKNCTYPKELADQVAQSLALVEAARSQSPLSCPVEMLEANGHDPKLVTTMVQSTDDPWERPARDGSLATLRTRCWCRCDPELVHPCLA